MKRPFNKLTKEDVELLRKKPAYGTCAYNFNYLDVINARDHLKSLYPQCRVQISFAAKILLLNDLY